MEIARERTLEAEALVEEGESEEDALIGEDESTLIKGLNYDGNDDNDDGYLFSDVAHEKKRSKKKAKSKAKARAGKSRSSGRNRKGA